MVVIGLGKNLLFKSILAHCVVLRVPLRQEIKKSHKTFAAGLTFAKHYFSLRLIAKWVENISQGELFGLLSNFDAKPDPNFGLT